MTGFVLGQDVGKLPAQSLHPADVERCLRLRARHDASCSITLSLRNDAGGALTGGTSTTTFNLAANHSVTRSTSAADPDKPGPIRFTAVGSGFHAVTPQAAVFWNPANTVTGNYSLKGTFKLMKPSSHTRCTRACPTHVGLNAWLGL